MSWVIVSDCMIVNMDHIVDIWIHGHAIKATTTDTENPVVLIKFTEEDVKENTACVRMAYNELLAKLNAKDIRSL